jgi:hypothetical protein
MVGACSRIINPRSRSAWARVSLRSGLGSRLLSWGGDPPDAPGSRFARAFVRASFLGETPQTPRDSLRSGLRTNLLSWGETPQIPRVSLRSRLRIFNLRILPSSSPSSRPSLLSYEGPSEARQGGVWVEGGKPGRNARKLSYEGPSEARPGGSGGFPPRKEGSNEGPSEARLGSPPGKKAHTKARAKRDPGVRGVSPQERRLIRRPERSETRGVWGGGSPRKEGSYEEQTARNKTSRWPCLLVYISTLL